MHIKVFKNEKIGKMEELNSIFLLLFFEQRLLSNRWRYHLEILDTYLKQYNVGMLIFFLVMFKKKKT